MIEGVRNRKGGKGQGKTRRVSYQRRRRRKKNELSMPENPNQELGRQG